MISDFITKNKKNVTKKIKEAAKDLKQGNKILDAKFKEIKQLKEAQKRKVETEKASGSSIDHRSLIYMGDEAAEALHSDSTFSMGQPYEED